MGLCWRRAWNFNKVRLIKGAQSMKRIIQAAFVVGIGFLATACDKCGNWDFSKPQSCRSTLPQN
jgi:hypothetical protein